MHRVVRVPKGTSRKNSPQGSSAVPFDLKQKVVMMIKLEELIGVWETADWRRRKAEEYPDDNRNMKAALLLERLDSELAPLNGTEIHHRLERHLERDDGFFLGEAIREELKSVGFRSWPETGRELVERIVDRLDS